MTATDSKKPVFLLSYEPGPGENKLSAPLATAAFSYDNALAIMALVSCGDVARARRIGDAFVYAAQNDRTFKDGRIRNAYRAGPVGSGAVLLPGWWDNTRRAWSEDAYQDGTQTGNVAWVALALLHLDRATSDRAIVRSPSRSPDGSVNLQMRRAGSAAALLGSMASKPS